MARKSYSTDEVLKALGKKNDVRVFPFRGVVEILSNTIVNKKGEIVPNPRKRYDLGNGSWGKIDFLVKQRDYSTVKVENFSKS